MKNFRRQYSLFSLCGLNCGLCPMHLDNYCPGCGGGTGNQPCGIARCSQNHDGIEYCHMCDGYPCEKYDGIDIFDSFITHRNQLKDFKKVRQIGINAYKAELNEKQKLLKYLLNNYNDGRKKSFFCIAVNLLELQDLQFVMEQIANELKSGDLTLKEKSKLAEIQFQNMAQKRNVVLKLNKKPKLV